MSSEAETLLKNCAWRLPPNINSLYRKVLGLVGKSGLDEKIKVALLVELYRYSFYEKAPTAVDPRVSEHFSTKILLDTERALNNGTVNKAFLKDIRKRVDVLRRHIDNPIELIKKTEKHREEHPGAMF